MRLFLLIIKCENVNYLTVRCKYGDLSSVLVWWWWLPKLCTFKSWQNNCKM